MTAGANTPAVYFFDHEDRSDTPNYAAGSSLGVFMLLLADKDRAYDEHWPARWELKLDPDIDKCPGARPYGPLIREDAASAPMRASDF